jgi:hypothetical protein
MTMIPGVCRTYLPAGLLLLAAASCAGPKPSAAGAAPLPPSIHGLPLVDSASGPAAAKLVDRMHQEAVAPLATWVGTYGGGTMQATLYVSRYQTATEAKAQLAAMAAGIGSGTREYGHHSVTAIAGTPVHSAFGHGQVHYFFARGRDVEWLALPPQLARVGLAVVLGVPADSVPPLAAPPLPATRDSTR